MHDEDERIDPATSPTEAERAQPGAPLAPQSTAQVLAGIEWDDGHVPQHGRWSSGEATAVYTLVVNGDSEGSEAKVHFYESNAVTPSWLPAEVCLKIPMDAGASDALSQDARVVDRLTAAGCFDKVLSAHVYRTPGGSVRFIGMECECTERELKSLQACEGRCGQSDAVRMVLSALENALYIYEKTGLIDVDFRTDNIVWDGKDPASCRVCDFGGFYDPTSSQAMIALLNSPLDQWHLGERRHRIVQNDVRCANWNHVAFGAGMTILQLVMDKKSLKPLLDGVASEGRLPPDKWLLAYNRLSRSFDHALKRLLDELLEIEAMQRWRPCGTKRLREGTYTRHTVLLRNAFADSACAHDALPTTASANGQG